MDSVPSPVKTISLVFQSSRAAIDLASIMVGVIIIGLIGSVIGATVFAVIPWAQDNAARASLSQVRTAEDAQRGLKEKYAGHEALSDNGFLQSQPGLAVRTNDAGTCYVGVIVSATGNMFWTSDKTGIAAYKSTALPTSPCLDVTGPGNLAAVTSPTTGGTAASVASKVTEDGAGSYETNGSGGSSTSLSGRAWYAYYRGSFNEKQNASLPLLKQLTGEQVTPTTSAQHTNLWLNVYHVHAYADGKELKVSGDNDAVDHPYTGFDINISYDKINNTILYYFHNNAGTSVIGDNSDATMTRLWKNGYVTFEVPGYTGTNVLHFNAQNPRSSDPSNTNRLSDWTGTLKCGEGYGNDNNCASLSSYGYNWQSIIPKS